MTPELIKILLVVLTILLVVVVPILGNAFCRPVRWRGERVVAFALAVIGGILGVFVTEALKEPQANAGTYAVLAVGYCYSFVSLGIFWKAWDEETKEDDRTILLRFVREEVQGRLHKMEVQVDQQIPIRAESMEVITDPQNLKNQPPSSLQKAKNMVGAIVSKVKLVIGGQEREILPGEKIVDIFNQQSTKELLILGAPGAGKTTALLTLALQLCGEAEKDIGKPIPIILELSAWQPPEKIPDWIAMQLKAKYQLSAATCEKYLKGGQFVLLLDGLDELKGAKDACIGAINEFRTIRGHEAQQLVVCSRLKDYGEASLELDIAGEYCLLPLSDKEIYDYLKKHQVSHIWESIALDPDGFLELARQPLLLDLMRKAYQDRSLIIPPKICQTEDERLAYQKLCQDRLLEDYVEHQLTESHDCRGYEPRKTKHYLEWLAQKLKQKPTTEFLLENMQPSWLEPQQRRGYQIAIGLILGLMTGMILGLIRGLMVGMIGVIIGGLMVGLIDIKPYEVLHLKLSSINLEKFREGLLGGLMVGLIGGLTVGGLIFGLIFGLVFGLIFGLQGSLRLREHPNKGIWNSGQNALTLTVLSSLFLVSLFTLLFLAANRPDNLPYALLTSIGISLLIGIYFGGGRPFIQHFVLRYFLIRAGHIPRDYIGFLSYAEERGLILWNGGSFRFYHDLLREHLAGDIPPPPPLPQKLINTWIVLLGFALLIIAFASITNATSPTGSGSMTPVIQNQDTLLRDRIIFRYRGLDRGNIVYFNVTENLRELGFEKVFSLRRIVGLPQETIEIKDGKVYINNQLLTAPYAVAPPSCTLPPTPIPADHYFVMGNNPAFPDCNTYSALVPKANITGQALWRLFPPARFGRIE